MATREPILYCLTRDRELATGIEERLSDALPFFYNDAARLHQAIMLRGPDIVVVDTGAIRPEYGDAGLAPVVAFVRQRASAARVAVRAAPGTERLVAAEAGSGSEILPAERAECVAAIARLCGCP